ncbi:integrase [Streptomyces lunaelactis]|uniref:integrase n=1 Tax=Streptomyces lunaelactis TaxID=1535768 RepID=UPI0020C7C8AF|nr:integrase [Streptomyces lunaelactis]
MATGDRALVCHIAPSAGTLARRHVTHLTLICDRRSGDRLAQWHHRGRTTEQPSNLTAITMRVISYQMMQRMGHSSVRAALIYQHLVNGRDHAIAAHVDEQIKKVRPADSAA